MPPPYNPPGRCIYCGKPPSASLDLTDEHIIALGLGWKWILPKASCVDCNDITTKLEDACIKGMFSSAKGQFGIKGRKSGRAPTFLTIGAPQGMKRELHRLHISQHPSAVIGFHFGESGASMGLTSYDEFKGAKVVITPIVDDFGQRVMRAGGNFQLIPRPINAETFARMIAKIAHAFAVAELGLGAFEPTLCNAVRGIAPMHIPQWIGTADSKTEPVGTERHELSIQRVKNWVGTELLTVRLRLFAQKETPIFYVVVGNPRTAKT